MENGNEVAWEIYEIGEPKPYGWSWRCRTADGIVRRSDVMYSTMEQAIDDAVAHGMRKPPSPISAS
jgi:hypothetical protein